MFDSYHFFIFVLLFLFSILLIIFDGFIPHARSVDVVTVLLALVPVIAFVYLARFRDADTKPFYLLFSALLVMYVVVFAGTRIHTLLNTVQ